MSLTCAATAPAQDASWRLEASGGLPSPFEPDIVFTLFAEFSAADYAFAGARLDFLATHDPVYGFFSEPTVLLDAPGTFGGAVTPTGVSGVVTGQLHFPVGGIFADPSNPIEVWQVTYTVTDFTYRRLHFETSTLDFRIYPDLGSSVSEVRPVRETSVTIIPPAPGPLATLLFGMSAIARRRR